MDSVVQYLLPCLCAFAGCIAFTLVFNIHGPGKLIAGCGGAWAGWCICWGARPFWRGFSPPLAISLFSEIMARLRRCPVTGYQLVALLPLVPGGGIYYAMRYCLAGDTERFLTTLLDTLGMAAALAVGVILASSLFRAAFLPCAGLRERRRAGDAINDLPAARRLPPGAFSPPCAAGGIGL